MTENERFMDDDKLKKAAAVYQSIQAPSDLRERVLQGVERESASVPVRKLSRRKIYKLGTLAACVAVLAVSVSLGNMEDQFAQLTPENLQTSPTAVYEAPDAVISDEGDPDAADVDEVMEKIGYPKETSDVSEPAAQPSTSGAEEKPAANNPEGKKSAAKPEATQLQNLRFLEEDENPAEEKSLASGKADGNDEGISVGKLLPGMLCSEKTLDDWEIRVVDAAEGTCTVEVSGGEKTATVVLTREDSSEES
ncbi:MAG: hypothetical protein ACI4LN_07065, partial [Anaerovoracaceae bacterium]